MIAAPAKCYFLKVFRRDAKDVTIKDVLGLKYSGRRVQKTDL